MKRKGYQGKLCILVIFSLILFSSSCGLPVYYIIYPPVNADSLPGDTQESRFFSFKTADAQNSTSDIYRGIDVYYKIYNNKNDRDSDISQIQAVNSEFSQSGFNKMQGLGYAKLSSEPKLHNSSDVLFDKEDSDHFIKIRLFDEGPEDSRYEAGFESDKISFNTGSEPIRSNGNSFQFGEKNLPAQGDADYTHNENEEESESFWVAAFAVSVGRDGFFQAYYSSLLPLGSIKIPKYTSN
jgi:hypothetical protein